MAWTEQCKIAFRTNASAKIGKQKRKNVSAVLRELARESGIPFNTLEHWFYEKNKSSAEISGTSSQEDDYSEVMCLECFENPIFLTPRGKPIGEDSKYYGLCKECKNYKSKLLSLDKIKNKDEGIETVCPNCHTVHLVNKKRIK